LRGFAVADPDLAAEARRRLAAAESISESFLFTPAAARLAGGAAEPEEPAPGAALPAAERYELGKCLGEGGMGRVVLAFDRQLGRSVPVHLRPQAVHDPVRTGGLNQRDPFDCRRVIARGSVRWGTGGVPPRWRAAR